jgi:hyaluronoglucosaminidase
VVDAVVHLPTTDENVALGSLVTASGTEPNTSFEPRNAVDGDLDTRWASGYDDASWLQVELSEPVRVGRAVLRWEAAFGESYDLQASDDGVTWRTVAEVRNGDGGVDTVRLDSTARFFRMQGVERATAWGYSLYELELYPVDASS